MADAFALALKRTGQTIVRMSAAARLIMGVIPILKTVTARREIAVPGVASCSSIGTPRLALTHARVLTHNQTPIRHAELGKKRLAAFRPWRGAK
jgi:hypothetical protein